jgi:hypothetical protein
MGDWTVAQSPIIQTTITVERLYRRENISFSEQFSKSQRYVPQGGNLNLILL